MVFFLLLRAFEVRLPHCMVSAEASDNEFEYCGENLAWPRGPSLQGATQSRLWLDRGPKRRQARLVLCSQRASHTLPVHAFIRIMLRPSKKRWFAVKYQLRRGR